MQHTEKVDIIKKQLSKTVKMGVKSNDLNGSSLYDRVKKLLVSYEWSDCSFSISGKGFKAHKLILGISSPVFEAMFYGPMSNSDNIVITDIEPDIFQLLLNYIYTDNVEITSIEESFELLYASRKYILEQLSEMCIAYIQANISLDNVTAILNYPDFMQDQELITSALQLFCEHADYLLKENKKDISPSCMKIILESNQMNVKEKDLIDHVFDWTLSYCEQYNIPNTVESRRDVLKSKGIFQLLRFFTLTLDELDQICTSDNNLLLPAEISCIKNVLIGSSDDIISVDKYLGACLALRNSLKLRWQLCHRMPLRSVAPIVIDGNNHTVHCRLKSSKPVFITSLCIPTRMAPILNFRNNAAKVYSEQFSVSVVDESDNSIIKFANFMNTVEYDSMVDIELSEPCFVKKDKWYKICFVWPQNQCITYSYVVAYRTRFYEDLKVTFEFEDISLIPGTSGSLLSGLKYCL